MPVFTRKSLRQRLGQLNLHDTYVGTNTTAMAAGGASAFFIDTTLANAAFSGESQYMRAWARHNGQTYRASSFNFPSGAFITNQTTVAGVQSGWEWELHELISPEDKNLAIDWAINRVWVRREVAFNSVDGLTHYSVGYEFGQVFNAYVWTNPTGSGDRGKGLFPPSHLQVELTASGREVRLFSAITGSQQIVIDAEVRATLGASDLDTVNVPNEQMVLYAAEAQAWEMIAKRAPAQDRRAYLQNAQRAAAAYSRLSQRFAPQRDSAPRFRNPVY